MRLFRPMLCAVAASVGVAVATTALHAVDIDKHVCWSPSNSSCARAGDALCTNKWHNGTDCRFCDGGYALSGNFCVDTEWSKKCVGYGGAVDACGDTFAGHCGSPSCVKDAGSVVLYPCSVEAGCTGTVDM